MVSSWYGRTTHVAEHFAREENSAQPPPVIDKRSGGLHAPSPSPHASVLTKQRRAVRFPPDGVPAGSVTHPCLQAKEGGASHCNLSMLAMGRGGANVFPPQGVPMRSCLGRLYKEERTDPSISSLTRLGIDQSTHYDVRTRKRW